MKTAIITGLTGQDGYYLSELLFDKGYKVYGLVRRSSRDSLAVFDAFEKKGGVVVYGDLRDIGALERAVDMAKPDEVYNLAAQSNVGVSFKVPEETMEIDYYGLGRLVNAVMKVRPDAHIYQASTSEMFGKTNPPQNEQSPFQPVSPYGEAKLKAHQDYVVGYRERHGLHISSGFLFNHESPHRGEHFVTRKITLSLARISLGLQECLELGNIDAMRDWGFAGDYVDAMWRIVQQDIPDDYVIATGETHTVRDFLILAAKEFNIDITFEGTGPEEIGKNQQGNVIFKVNPIFYRPHEVDALLGDSSKARQVLDWKPAVTFPELVAMMAQHDRRMLAQSLVH